MKKIILNIILIALILGCVVNTMLYIGLHREFQSIEPDIVVLTKEVVGEKGEKGETGVTGARGEKGESGELPEGHWETYCLYPSNEFGYRSKGVMIRKDTGDCKSGWEKVKIWEK